jgi:hypothetical protein
MRLLPIILLAGLISLLGGCKNKSRASYSQEQQDALNELATIQDEQRDALKMTEEGLVIDQGALDKTQKATAKAADQIGGTAGQALKVVAEFQAESNTISKEIARKGQQFLQMIDWESLATKGDYEARRQFMMKYAQYNRDVTEFFENAPDNISKRLDEINFQGQERNQLEQGFNAKFTSTLTLIRGIRQCEITACEIGIRLIDLLEKEQGKWRLDAATDTLEFDNDDTLAAFNKAIAEFQVAGARQVELQQEFVDSNR